MRPWLAVLLLLAAASSHATHAPGHRRRRLTAEDVVKAAVIGGTNAPRGRYPYMASLRANDGVGDWDFCGGTLIHPRVIMTAAQCVVNATTGRQYDRAYYLPQVRIGGLLRTKDKPSDYELRKVLLTNVHPDFVAGWKNEYFDNDVALMLLDEPSRKTPIRLAPYTPKPALPVQPGVNLVALGWGYTTNLPNSEAEVLQQTRMRLLPLSSCQQTYGRVVFQNENGKQFVVNRDFDSNSQMCDAHAATFPLILGGTCTGDGGGPHLLPGRDARGDVQYGIDSYGEAACGENAVVMTSVASVREWVDWMVETMTSVWTGKVYNDPQVIGFDGIKFSANNGGPKLRILTADSASPPISIISRLGKGPQEGTTVMRQIDFKYGAFVQIGFETGRKQPVVLIDSKTRVQPGQAVSIPGGAVRFRRIQADMNHVVVVDQPGLSIRVIQRYIRGTGQYATWLDMYVFISKVPRGPLGGVLGRTFPKEALDASSANDVPLQASLVSTIVQGA